MKKIENKNGFTLIEMLVVLAIIGVLSLIIGFSATTLTGNASKNRDKEVVREILNAASSYAELTSSCSSGCNVTLDQLVNKGLIDKNITQKNNPVYKDIVKYDGTDKVSITRSTDGVKTVSFGCVNLENIDDIDTWWGKCQ